MPVLGLQNERGHCVRRTALEEAETRGLQARAALGPKLVPEYVVQSPVCDLPHLVAAAGLRHHLGGCTAREQGAGILITCTEAMRPARGRKASTQLGEDAYTLAFITSPIFVAARLGQFS